jgi:hypothetical protein
MALKESERSMVATRIVFNWIDFLRDEELMSYNTLPYSETGDLIIFIKNPIFFENPEQMYTGNREII